MRRSQSHKWLEQAGPGAGRGWRLPKARLGAQTRNLPRFRQQFAFWATFSSSEFQARRRAQGVALTFPLLQAARQLRVLFLRRGEEGGIWPAQSPGNRSGLF